MLFFRFTSNKTHSSGFFPFKYTHIKKRKWFSIAFFHFNAKVFRVFRRDATLWFFTFFTSKPLRLRIKVLWFIWTVHHDFWLRSKRRIQQPRLPFTYISKCNVLCIVYGSLKYLFWSVNLHNAPSLPISFCSSTNLCAGWWLPTTNKVPELGQRARLFKYQYLPPKIFPSLQSTRRTMSIIREIVPDACLWQNGAHNKSNNGSQL